AHRSASNTDLDGVFAADQAVYNRKLSEETRNMSVSTGLKLAELTLPMVPSKVLQDWRDAIAAGHTPGTYPVGLGVVFAGIGASEAEAFAVHLHGTTALMLNAALRLMRVDHNHTQQLLFELNSTIDDDYAEVAGDALDAMASFAPVADILASIHVGAHIRMFMN
ncbi:MAG: urease accessory UreF family protein, partial [Actinomycetes bacterium]